LKNYIEIVNEEVVTEEGIQLIEKYLLTVYFDSPISNKELARKLMIPIPLVTAIKKEFIKQGILTQFNGISITDKGRVFAEQTYGLESIDKQLYRKLIEEEIDVEEVFSKELNFLKVLLQQRPNVDRSLDQAHCTFETSFVRSLLTIDYSCLLNKKILCLGDDDLVSISIGLLLKRLYGDMTFNKTEINVFDIDERYLDYISDLATKHNLPIKCHLIDLREPFVLNYVEEYDCLFTDPPYTISGLDLFLSRGISALKTVKGLPIFLSFAHKSYDESYKMLEKFYEMGLCINQIVPSFNEYEGGAIIGNIGQLIVLQTTSKTSPHIENSCMYLENLYTREVKLNLRGKGI
jgi:predicted methyltransferase